MPRLSVVIPAHNALPWLTETLDAIARLEPELAGGIETIVVDDGSRDRTAETAERCGAKLIRLERPSGGPAGPRNTGIKVASGEFIAIVDADDIPLPGRFARPVELLDRYPDLGLVFSDAYRFRDGSDEFPGRPFMSDYRRLSDLALQRGAPLEGGAKRLPALACFELLIAENFIPTSSVTLRRSWVERLGLFDATLGNGDDLDLWFRCARDADLAYIAEPLLRYRERVGSISTRGAELAQGRIAVLRRLRQHPLSPRAARELSAKIAENLIGIGYQLQNQGRLGEARRAYLESLRESPQRSAWLGLAVTLMGQKLWRLSRRLRGRAVEAHP